jgi:3-hydroxyisobutyrate dehydrogenase-like beta-hydroxyacid dehydrogenase
MNQPVGLIGLGNMGAALAERLLASRPVAGFDPSPDRQTVARERGVTVADSAASITDSTDVVILSLPHPSISARTIADELTPVERRPLTIIETSTVLPSDARAAADACATAGIGYVCAAILSGTASVANGTTTLLVGGREAALAAAAPVLDAISASQRMLGDPAAAMAAKVINNAVAHDVFVVLSEALALATANGVQLATLVDLLQDPGGGLMRPLTHRIAHRVATSNYEGGMSVASARKDSQLALEMAQTDGVPLFVTQAAHTVYEIAAACGLHGDDYAAVATLWERWRKQPGSRSTQ